MSNMDRVIFGCLLLCGLVSGAWACTTSGWNGGTAGSPTAASPPAIARFSEFCAMSLSAQGHVQDNNPNHTQMIFRFYVLPDLTTSGTAKIFAAYSAENGTGELLDITWNRSQFSFNPTGGTPVQVVASDSNWHLIEVAYNAGNTSSVWVDRDATVDPANTTFTAPAGTVQSVRLGLPDGLGGFTGGNINFDAYESHATTPVGPEVVCDAQGDSVDVPDIDINDVLAVVDEVFNSPPILAPGQPDCDLNGSVNINDALAIVDIVF